jgi:hypothetical protein
MMAGMADAPTLRIRSSRVALLPAVFVFVFVTPVAGTSTWLLALFLIPVVLVAWVVRAGVDVTSDGLTLRALLGTRRLRWDQVAGLAVGERGKVSAVLRSGDQVRLPATRLHDLPLISAASGGRIPDITPHREAPTT